MSTVENPDTSALNTGESCTVALNNFGSDTFALNSCDSETVASSANVPNADTLCSARNAETNSSPRLVVGMGTIDDYIPLAQAGADEIFCGYIPADWAEAFGDFAPMNRREVLYTNVQIGSFSELEILHDIYQDYHVPVTLTLNRPKYDAEMIPYLKSYMERCAALGFCHFIVADPELLPGSGPVESKEAEPGSRNFNYPEPDRRESDSPTVIHEISAVSAFSPHSDTFIFHLSGEYGELNHLVLEELLIPNKSNIKRIIFPRQTTLGEMEQLIGFLKSSGYHLEYEAFAFNEKCHYTGAYCNSMHSDYFCHMCLLPYQLAKQSDGGNDKLVYRKNSDGSDRKLVSVRGDANSDGDALISSQGDAYSDDDMSVPGASGCGLCALYRLREIGVTHLKLVSRGNYTEDTLQDVKVFRQALDILSKSSDESAYIRAMKQAIFPNGCSGNCYYREMMNKS